ncbi:MAG: LPS assembly protein LptD [Idiomarina sp.]
MATQSILLYHTRHSSTFNNAADCMTHFKTSAGLILIGLISTPAMAQSYTCAVPEQLVTVVSEPIPNLPLNAIGVRADRAVLQETSAIASFYGNVEVQRNNQRLFTEQAEINQQSGSIEASGATSFNDGFVQVVSEDFRLASASDSAQLSQARYQLSENGARGKADLLELSPSRVALYGSSFTTCPDPVPAWQLSASEITISEDNARGEAWHAKFEMFGVPVFYLPYISFPTTDARKSGLLFPTFRSSSKNGAEFELPYYFNIAPNMDATVTPRYMAERGLQGQVEFRYMDSIRESQLNFEYLPEDRSLATDTSRFLWHVDHQVNWDQNWRGYINGTGISDDDYLNDFGSEFASRADTQLYRHLQVDYFSDSWHTQIRAEDIDVLGPYRSPYRSMPVISSRYEQGDNRFTYSVYSELAHFRNQDDSSDYTSRMHLQPTLNYSVEKPAYDWLAEVGYSFTYYNQTSPDPMVAASVKRSLPNLRWRGRLNFERELDWGGDTYRQTLQPQIQYLYVPYTDQSDIGIYDTTLMQEDYNGLFRARRFTGLDRIADANQVTIGATTSFLNDKAEEVLRFSLANIQYFEDSETQLFNGTTEVTTGSADFAGELSFRINDRWSFNSAIQYDGELNRTQKSQTAVEYRKDHQNLIQINHRTATNLLDEDIEQIGMQGAWNVSPQWQVAGNWYYDLNNSFTNDAMLGVQYSNCCWAVQISGYRRINRNLEAFQPNQMQAIGQPEFDNGVSVQFIIKGLGSSNRGLLDMLEQSLFGYRRPFYLSN